MWGFRKHSRNLLFSLSSCLDHHTRTNGKNPTDEYFSLDTQFLCEFLILGMAAINYMSFL